MKISVVMTTYNGEKYVEEQLDSIRVQTRKADEVLLSFKERTKYYSEIERSSQDLF